MSLVLYVKSRPKPREEKPSRPMNVATGLTKVAAWNLARRNERVHNKMLSLIWPFSKDPIYNKLLESLCGLRDDDESYIPTMKQLAEMGRNYVPPKRRSR